MSDRLAFALSILSICAGMQGLCLLFFMGPTGPSASQFLALCILSAHL